MKVFHCDHCGQLVFFENTQCVSCGHRLAFLPDVMDVGSLEVSEGDRWTSPSPSAGGRVYRLCRNFTEHDICNWATLDSDSDALCESCRLTRVIPDLTVPGTRDAWYRLELAKRRVIYTLKNLNLPISAVEGGAASLEFQFMADDPSSTVPVLTGHASGVITINIAEADDAERERRRLQLGEPYRTLLGHLRHEVGHYYWGRLIEGSPRLDGFRELFGDERTDYAQSLRNYYDNGPRPDWQANLVTAYASAHPWEDWAETWAHYMHMTDTLEIAAACGVSVRPVRSDEPSLKRVPSTAGRPESPFDRLIASWFTLVYVLNNLNRGMGLPDAYPFVLSPPAIEKLRFVHDTVAAAGGDGGRS